MTCCPRRDANVGKIIALLSYRAVINPVITCHVPIIITTGTPLTPDLERERVRVRERQIQHDPTIADGYVRYACLGLWRCLVVNVMTCVGLCVRVCVCAYPSIHCSNYPWVCLGKTQSFCCDRKAGQSWL